MFDYMQIRLINKLADVLSEFYERQNEKEVDNKVLKEIEISLKRFYKNFYQKQTKTLINKYN